MGTRQLRISDRNKVSTTIQQYIGKPITVVLKDKTAMFGLLMAVKGQTIVLENRRLQKMQYPFDRIDEVYIDTSS